MPKRIIQGEMEQNNRVSKMSADYLTDLNPQQRRAVEHGVSSSSFSPLLVIAGAGSGKTKTLSNRVAHLLVNGVDPNRILLLTFSRRAAIEMKRRVGRITASALGTEFSDLQWSGTFHAIGARLLREYAARIGLKPSFTILDRSDAADLMNLVRHDLGQSKKESRFPRKELCLAIYSFAVNSGQSLSEILASNFPWCGEWEDELRKLFAAYTEAKQKQNVVDYDDLLLCWSEMMNDEDLAAEIGSRFDYILVDEYQDTNGLQSKLLLKLKPDGNGLMVVGDDAQSIYSFRAATIRNILDFPNHFRPSAEIVTLEQNYRSSQPILDACNNVIGFAKERYTKNLYSGRQSKQKPFLTTVPDETAQARYIGDQILEARERGIALKAQAVLFRASHHSAQLEIELARRNIPFVKYGGLKFLEAAHVKDVLSVLRWCQNPSDTVAGFRVLQLLPGIGPSTAGKIIERLGGKLNGKDLAAIKAPTPSLEAWPDFASLISTICNTKKEWPHEFHRVRVWYEPLLQLHYDDFQPRLADLAQLEQIAGGYTSREKFLTELTLDPPDATSGKAGAAVLDDDYTILSTIHSAKGQEWKIVRVLNAVDGCIPSDMATGTPEGIEEERRLLYVAMTRAKDELDLIVPQRFYTYKQSQTGDRHVYTSISRFIPTSIHQHFDRRYWPKSAAVYDIAGRKSGPSIDVTARLKLMWR